MKLGFYPYTYVRTNVMRSKLLKKEEYKKLLKMKLNEVTRYLEESEYKKEIDEIAVHYSGYDLIELALNKNIEKSFQKLKRISPDELNLLIKAYLMRNDVWNIKTIIRGKYTKEEDEKIKRLLLIAGVLEADFYETLMKKETIEDVLRAVPFLNFREIKPALQKFREKNILVDIENALDKHYYNYLMEFTKTLPKQGKLFKEFLESEIEILNILMVLRLRKENIAKEEIKNYLILTDDESKNRKILRLLAADNLENIPEKISNKELRDVLEKGLKSYKDTGSLIDTESRLYKYLLRKSTLLIHQHPLSVDVILGYMFAKELELKNLKTLIKGKQIGLSDEFIENELVI